MKFIYKIIITLGIFYLAQISASANTPYFLDFKYILNQSEAGKKLKIILKPN